MDPRFRDLSFLSETERSALVEFASKTVMPSLPASSDVASTTFTTAEEEVQVRGSRGRVAW